jgi:hypothetical protein
MPSHGGARVTTAPSKPDAMSKPDVSNLAMQYGEGAELKDLQEQGQVGRPGNAVPAGGAGGGQPAPALDLAGIVPLDAPTQRPNEALTTPAASVGTDRASVNQYDAKSLSPEFMAYLVSRASQPGAPLELRRLAREITAQRGQ